ncbi:MAG: CBS domain-containing protein [Tannerellaceae bacterium]|nr:CBS domain-containing protein [Tannerellaceae bacterium]
MLRQDFISKNFPALEKSAAAAQALSVMSDLKTKHLPVVDGGAYIGLLAEKDLLAEPDADALACDMISQKINVGPSADVHETVALMMRHHLTVLPVVSPEGNYMGAITRDGVLDALAALCNIEAAGSVVVLELQPRDYALSDIARIIEANNAHVLSLLSETDKETGQLVITIKTDLEDATPIARSFEHFNYAVRHHSMRTDADTEVIQRRINELLHYINI